MGPNQPKRSYDRTCIGSLLNTCDCQMDKLKCITMRYVHQAPIVTIRKAIPRLATVSSRGSNRRDYWPLPVRQHVGVTNTTPTGQDAQCHLTGGQPPLPEPLATLFSPRICSHELTLTGESRLSETTWQLTSGTQEQGSDTSIPVT